MTITAKAVPALLLMTTALLLHLEAAACFAPLSLRAFRVLHQNKSARPIALKMGSTTLARSSQEAPITIKMAQESSCRGLMASPEQVRRQAHASILSKGSAGIAKNDSWHKFILRDMSWQLLFIAVSLGKVTKSHPDLARILAIKKR